jgi:hypothetical protein
MKQNTVLHNENGSTVLLLLLVAGVATFLVLANLQSQADHSFQIFKVSRTIKQDGKFLDSTIHLLMHAPPACQSNLANTIIKTTTTASLTKLNYGDGAGHPVNTFLNLLDPNKRHFGKKTVTSIVLAPHPTKFGADAAGVHLTVMNLTFDDGATLRVPIYVTTDAGGRILTCHATSFLDTDATGVERTLDEKLCSSGPNQTANWKTGDCIECVGGSGSLFYCIDCKNKGKIYDPAAQTCT